MAGQVAKLTFETAIKGFAVTLSIGVLSSMFTAIIVTRVLAEIIYENQNLKIKRLNI